MSDMLRRVRRWWYWWRVLLVDVRDACAVFRIVREEGGWNRGNQDELDSRRHVIDGTRPGRSDCSPSGLWIVADPGMLGGTPTIRNHRIDTWGISRYGDWTTGTYTSRHVDEVWNTFPQLRPQQIRQAFEFHGLTPEVDDA